MVIPMVEKLYFKENKSNKPWLIFLGIVLFLLVFGFSIYGSVSNFFQGLGKTAPEKVFNNTYGEFEIIPHPYMSFQEYYQKVKPAETFKYFDNIEISLRIRQLGSATL
jgi:hypothetical protein